MRVEVVPVVSEKGWHGSHELARFSTVYRGQAVLVLFGRRFNLGEPYVVVEVIHEWLDKSIGTDGQAIVWRDDLAPPAKAGRA